MTVERERLIELLEDSYSAYYNISKENLPAGLPLVFRAEFFKRDERYWLSKQIPIYGNEENEYFYLFSAPEFDVKSVSEAVDFALNEALPKVKPHKEHQYTNVKTLFVADSFSDEAVEFIKKKNFQKSYHFSFWGYSSLITCGVKTPECTVFYNRAGATMKSYFSKLLAAEEKNRKKLSQG